MARGDATVLYDGDCGLCQASVGFAAARDPAARLRFAPLRSEAAAKVLAPLGRTVGDDERSLLLVEDGRIWDRSDAALRIARRLRFPWRLAWALVLVPRPARDLAYRLVARNRHRLLRRRDACPAPPPALRDRLL